jgi:hypothetical protein
MRRTSAGGPEAQAVDAMQRKAMPSTEEEEVELEPQSLVRRQLVEIQAEFPLGEASEQMHVFLRAVAKRLACPGLVTDIAVRSFFLGALALERPGGARRFREILVEDRSGWAVEPQAGEQNTGSNQGRPFLVMIVMKMTVRTISHR